MKLDAPHFALRLAEDDADLRAAQRLRYAVFVEELGADGAMVDHAARLEKDRFDPFFDHLLLIDRRRAVADQVIGVYRLMRGEGAMRAGQFYSEGEFDLSALRGSGRRLLELGRSCVHPDYRGGTAMMHLWNGLSDYISRHRIDVMFGVASFHGRDPTPLAASLSLLHHRHLAPEAVRPVARPDGFQPMDLMAPDALDRVAAMRATPALIKAYLRLGGHVGQGAYIDRAFNCIDICLVMDAARLSDTRRAIYRRRAGVPDGLGPA